MVLIDTKNINVPSCGQSNSVVCFLGKELYKLYREDCKTHFPGHEYPSKDEKGKTTLHYAVERNFFQSDVFSLACECDIL